MKTGTLSGSLLYRGLKHNTIEREEGKNYNEDLCSV